MCRDHLALRESLEDGGELGVTEQEGCLDRLAPRATAALTAWLACRERRATGVTLVPLAHQDFQETTEKGVTTEKSGPEGCPGSPVHVVCWGQRGPPALQDLLV